MGDSTLRYDIFISYKSDDSEWVSEVARDLTGAGLRVYFAPEEMQAGRVVSSELSEAIVASDFAVIVLSKDTLRSAWVELELNIIIHRHVTARTMQRIIPVLLQIGAPVPTPLKPQKHLRAHGLTPAVAARHLHAIIAHERGLTAPELADVHPNTDTLTPEAPTPPKHLTLERVELALGERLLAFVTLPDEPIALAAYPFTRRDLSALLPDNSDLRTGGDLPLTRVSTNDARLICRRFSEATGAAVRLPSPSEWERAYRAGSSADYFVGDSPSLLPDYGHIEAQAPAPVGTRRPNPWGLFDMVGNVWELCVEPSWTICCVARGGSYRSAAEQCSANNWIPVEVDERNDQVGFRPLLDLKTQE